MKKQTLIKDIDQIIEKLDLKYYDDDHILQTVLKVKNVQSTFSWSLEESINNIDTFKMIFEETPEHLDFKAVLEVLKNAVDTGVITLENLLNSNNSDIIGCCVDDRGTFVKFNNPKLQYDNVDLFGTDFYTSGNEIENGYLPEDMVETDGEDLELNTEWEDE